MPVESIGNLNVCVSQEERRQRPGIAAVNLIFWAALILFFVCMALGATAVTGRHPENGAPSHLFWVITLSILLQKFAVVPLLSEFNVRRLQAMGAAVSADQFPAVYRAAAEVRRQFGIRKDIRILVLASGEMNAFAIKFARKRVVVILSRLLEGIIDNPAELRALLAHEMCHTVLDHGPRGWFEIYKPGRYRCARELTCDNAGYAAAGDLRAAKDLLKRLCAGNILHRQLSEETLVAEGNYIYSGFIGRFLRNSLTHPPAGKRLENLARFAAEHPAVPVRVPLEVAEPA